MTTAKEFEFEAYKTSNEKIQQSSKQDVIELVGRIAKNITPVWPLETFIALNPLSGYESMEFEEALDHAGGQWNQALHFQGLEKVNAEMIKWCGAFLDMGQGTIQMPNREKGFYAGFLSLAKHDHHLHLGLDKKKQWINELPLDSVDAILHCLETLDIDSNDFESFLFTTLEYLPGWAGYVKWREERDKERSGGSKQGVRLIDFLAVRLVLTVMLWPEVERKKP